MVMNNFLMNDQNVYWHNAVIPPPEVPTEVLKNVRLVIDSKDRNTSLYPEQNAYEVKLPDEYNDVTTAKLINADITLVMYLINKYFDKIYVNIGNSIYTIQLDHGDYTPETLATAITNKLNALNLGTFSVSYSSQKDNFIFTSDVAFSLDFTTPKNNIHSILGFAKGSYSSSQIGSAPLPHVVNAPYRKNFNHNNCIIMYIDQFDTYHSPTTEMNKCFAIIPSVYRNLNISDNAEITKVFSPPIPKLSRLMIKFFDRYGNPYDFQNTEHRFEIILTSHKQPRKYNSIFAS